MSIRKEIAPKQAWIIHGFRGKPQLAEQFIKNGFYISFGEMFNAESLKATPKEKLFIESDESKTGINEIYSRVAETLGCSVEELASTIMQNAEKVSVLTI
jgi:TatD DNase family protein